MPDTNARDELAQSLLEHRPIGTFRGRNKTTGERAGVTECYCGWTGPGYAGHVSDVLLARGWRKVDPAADTRVEYGVQRFRGYPAIHMGDRERADAYAEMHEEHVVMSRTVTIGPWQEVDQ